MAGWHYNPEMTLSEVLRKVFGAPAPRDPDDAVALTDIAPKWNDMKRIQETGVYYGLGPVMRGQLNGWSAHGHTSMEGWH